MFNWKLHPNLTTEAAMTGELPWRSLTALMYVHGCLATEMCMEKSKKNKQKKKPKHSKQSFRSHVLEELSQDTFLGSCDGHWPFFMTLRQSWFNLKAAGPMMMMNIWSWLSTEVEWVIQWNIHTFAKGFKNTYQTILDVGYSAWSGTVLTDMQYRQFYAMLFTVAYQTFFCRTGSTVLFSVLLDKCRFTACCMDVRASVDTSGLFSLQALDVGFEKSENFLEVLCSSCILSLWPIIQMEPPFELQINKNLQQTEQSKLFK